MKNIDDTLLSNSVKNRTQLESDVANIIIDSRDCESKHQAKKLLMQAKSICNGASRFDNPNIPSLKLEVLTELATDTNSAEDRHDLWMQALVEGFSVLSSTPNPDYAVHLYRKVVDFSQDPHKSSTVREIVSFISQSTQSIDLLIPKYESSISTKLLACKASLLRAKTRHITTRNAQKQTCEQSIRCAEKACELGSDSWDAFLQLAMTHWHMAQYEKNNKAFNTRLEEAEACFWESIEREPNRINTIALARYFRYTYQSIPFLKAYEQYSLLEYNKREYYRGSFLYAEGVLQLHDGNYPKSMVDASLEDADRLLEAAIDAGYGEARHVVALAFLKAVRGDVSVGVEVAKLLHPSDKDSSWDEIAEAVCNRQLDSDLFAKGFALGIEFSGVWNKLGTFAKRYLGDTDLAISMYRTSLRLNKSNAVSMTNLSRTLLHEGTSESIREANRWISKAASCADRRFKWWRNVREEVLSALDEGGTQTVKSMPKNISNVDKLNDLKKIFYAIKNIENPQERGYRLEELVAQLVYLSLGNCKPSYRAKLKWSDNSIYQIDAAFCVLDTQYFRVETKWTSDPVGPKDIVNFRDKLDVVGVKGLVISMNGFTPEAITKAVNFRGDREILLMNGDELEIILSGYPTFDEAIRQKQQYFAIESNPYHQIAPTIQEEVD